MSLTGLSATSPGRSPLNGASPRWRAGWWAAGGVVALAAGLLLTLIGLARRITRQAGEITEALEVTQQNTKPMFELLDTNRSVERILTPLRGRE